MADKKLKLNVKNIGLQLLNSQDIAAAVEDICRTHYPGAKVQTVKGASRVIVRVLSDRNSTEYIK